MSAAVLARLNAVSISQCPRPSPSVPIVGKRYMIRLKNTDVEPLPDYDFSWFVEDDEASELVEGAAGQ